MLKYCGAEICANHECDLMHADSASLYKLCKVSSGCLLSFIIFILYMATYCIVSVSRYVVNVMPWFRVQLLHATRCDSCMQ